MLLRSGAHRAGEFRVSALHSSIDINECVRLMEEDTTGPRQAGGDGDGDEKEAAAAGSSSPPPTGGVRQIVLATNIAESSITIPRCGHVVDTCLTLQVVWKRLEERHRPQLAWTSQVGCVVGCVLPISDLSL